ncbi:MAG: response regulator transcription factor [Solitalea-like symbiont of Tyrophagus putrescentiae]
MKKPETVETIKIALIEDDVQLNDTLKFCLKSEGFKVLSAYSIKEGRELIMRERPHIVLLDWGLPDGEGVELCEQLRNDGFRNVIFLLTVKKDSFDKVKAYKAGITEYYVKPVHPAVLISMIYNKLEFLSNVSQSEEIYRIDDIEYHPRTHTLFKKGNRIEITVIENRILYYFVSHPNKIINREALNKTVWDNNNNINTRTIDMHIVRLRKKVENDANNPNLIITLRGKGYMFVNKKDEA